MTQNKDNISRRGFLKAIGAGAVASATALTSCKSKQEQIQVADTEPPVGKMTYRVCPTTGDKVSLLGYGCMRLPTVSNVSARESEDDIDQEQVNRLVDYAIAHGVNYFDTSPAYCKGRSETAMGRALSRHKRSEYFIATKLSNFAPETWSREKSLEMYHNSFKNLQVDTIDYMLLHGIGMAPAGEGMYQFEERYINNGILGFLLSERAAGRIRNLGFSYHGDIEVFDLLLSQHDKYKWDFALIQLNYVDWRHAKQGLNKRNTDAEYLYTELEKRGIPAIIMEPLLGGRLASLPDKVATQLRQRDPESSVASWAFRYAGTPKGVLTVLSGMTYMEHLRDNLRTYSPLRPITPDEDKFLMDTANMLAEFPLIQCNDCKYCMPCPYGLDIPGIFVHYNKCVNQSLIADSRQSDNYREARRAFLVGYDRSVPRLRQANHCIGCRECVGHCPQKINIPAEMKRIDKYVEQLKQDTLGDSQA